MTFRCSRPDETPAVRKDAYGGRNRSRGTGTFNPVHSTRKHHHLRTHVLDEQSLRLVAAPMVLSLGYGGQKAIHAVTGLFPDTLRLGIAQLQGKTPLDPDRIRRPGDGRKPITEIFPELATT